MRALTNLLFKVTLSSMILTAPAMITGSKKDAGHETPAAKEPILPYYSAAVIKKFVNYSSLLPLPVYSEDRTIKNTGKRLAFPSELKTVINQAIVLYTSMGLEQSGLDEKAFEYAWRGYHHLLKKGLIRKKSVLSICDFSQPSSSKRLYVIDVRHKRLLYRTYVAHGQNSGSEYASSFSNEPESFKSSLGFYVTRRTYYGRNGLSLKMEGMDTGYNDLAGKRNIVLHGSPYVSLRYMHNNGALGTSLGCPALPASISPRIIRAVKNGSCFFIYHPTKKYLEQSSILNG